MSHRPTRFRVLKTTPEPEWNDVLAQVEDGVVVIGAGGHAKVLISALTASGRSVAAVVDDDDTKWGTHAQGVRVGRIERALGGHGIVGIGDNAQRRARAESLSLPWPPVVPPSAHPAPP